MDFTWEADFVGIEDKWNTVEDDVKQRALYMATTSLLMLTNYRVGTPPVTIRPCPEERPCGHDWLPYRLMSEETGSFLNQGRFLNPCGCRTARWCSPLSEVDIPGPVGYISSLKIDGAIQDLNSGDWRIDNGHLLVWQGDGASPIPATQNLDKDDSKPGTWSITYSKSYPLARDAKIAVGLLALEFVKAFKPRGECRLPRGVTSVSRSGVAFTIEAGMFPQGLTGIDVVDAFIMKWTPPGSPNRNASVFSPRNRKPRVTSTVRTAP